MLISSQPGRLREIAAFKTQGGEAIAWSCRGHSRSSSHGGLPCPEAVNPRPSPFRASTMRSVSFFFWFFFSGAEVIWLKLWAESARERLKGRLFQGAWAPSHPTVHEFQGEVAPRGPFAC